jgi:hypothetical protein
MFVRILFAVVTIFISIPLKAQSILPNVINSGGAESKLGFPSLDYSIGEQSSITQYNSNSNFKLTAGFLQSFELIVTGLIVQPWQEGIVPKLFPNPAKEFTWLKGALSKPGFLEFQLIDITGRILESYSPVYFQYKFEKEFYISSLPAGLYFILVIYSAEGYKQATSLKLLKSN